MADDTVLVPADRLAPETLRRLAEEFVTREGTDYGAVERTLEAKVASVLRQIGRGDVLIVCDVETGATNLVRREAGGVAAAPPRRSNQ